MNFRIDSPFLYKYCDPTGVDILNSLRLKVTPPNQCNDPFEFTPKLNLNLTLDSLKDLPIDDNRFLEFWEKMPIETRGRLDFSEFQKAFRRELSSGFQTIPLKTREALLKLCHDNMTATTKMSSSFLSEVFGVVCLSEVPDDILMWSHYTTSRKGSDQGCHKGFVVGFDVQNQFIKEAKNLAPVEYSSERATVDVSAKGVNQDPQAYIPSIRRKSLHWAYEREWRLICELKKCAPSVL
jgi:hypothetical protein